MSCCRPHGSEYHFDVTVFDHTKCVIPHSHTFGLLSHHGSLGRRRKSPLDGAVDFLSKIRPHITTVSFVSALIFVFIRKPADVYKHVEMGPKHSFVQFKLLWCCLYINSWSSSNICMLEKDVRVIPSQPSYLVIHFRFQLRFSNGEVI